MPAPVAMVINFRLLSLFMLLRFIYYAVKMLFGLKELIVFILQWLLLHDFFKLVMEIGETVEAAGVADFLDRQLVFHNHPAGFSDSEFNKELQVGFAGLRFEISAE